MALMMARLQLTTKEADLYEPTVTTGKASSLCARRQRVQVQGEGKDVRGHVYRVVR
jgi:hypothetical protein